MVRTGIEREFTAFFPFCGLGAGALGFLGAEIRLFNTPARFRSIGGVDINEEACSDFEMLTQSPALCADMFEVTPDDLRARFGRETPDVIFSSPPCQGMSALLSAELAQSPKYQRLNELVVRWLELMLTTWSPLPRLIIMENVPRITSRGAELLKRAHRMLKSAGFLVEQGYHDCGELGGLAQHRKRFLLVGRNPARCVPALYKPPLKRVRGCGEVLQQLPVPGTPQAAPFGKMHTLPRTSLLNLIRLALIPAGGDWRDIKGVLKEGQKRREVHKRHELLHWERAAGTVAGSGSNGVQNVADPRLESGVFISGDWHPGVLGVRGWDESSGTVTGRASASTGAFAVADPRVKVAYDAGYKVLRWSESAHTIAGKAACGTGAYQVADPRSFPVEGRFVPWDELLRLPELLGCNPARHPSQRIVIISPDGCWHRPLTTLELAVLQGLPPLFGGKPLALAGKADSRHRERIGNAVPVQTAQAIAERMLVTLSNTKESSFELFPQNGGDYWVEESRWDAR